MMLRILRDKFLRLGRDDDGMAMVVTLAVFMFMWLVCAGVFAIGAAVKTRIHLQNACDAAAYSAAVVQADTLSRIATINRAMSWTYVQMTRRQMDYIVYKWLRHTCDHYIQDKIVAESWHFGSPPCPLGHHTHPNGWFIGHDSQFDYIGVNGRNVSYGDLKAKCDEFDTSYMNRASNRRSFYVYEYESIDSARLAGQIRQDKITISEMNGHVRGLANNLPNKVRGSVEGVLQANLDGRLLAATRYFIEQSANPLGGVNGYLNELSGAQNESRFFWFGGYFGNSNDMNPVNASEDILPSSPAVVFETGYDTWFPFTGGSDGFRRDFRQCSDDLLGTRWEWWSSRWSCHYVPATAYTPGYWVHPEVPYPGACPHQACSMTLPNGAYDACKKGGKWFRAHLKARDVRDVPNGGMSDCFSGQTARPLVVARSYFEKPGTITVGLARHNDNPWVSVLRSITGGIFTAFNPFVEWTVCFSSAKAGYKFIGVDPNNREYRVGWLGSESDWTNENQSWNLCQSDWDAVFIPVRRAESFAGGAWEDRNMGFIQGYVDGEWMILGGSPPSIDTASNFLSGGNGIDVSERYGARDLGDEYRFGRTDDDSPGFWRGADLPLEQDATGRVTARWQIGNPSNPIDWGELQRVMFH